MIEAIAALAPRFPHQQAYLDAGAGRPARVGRRAAAASPTSSPRWRCSGPSSTAGDGIEHLVVFPMYTPNGSPDTRFEALIMRTPWPEFVARLERERYDNEKYVPVQLVDFTDGYDSECAVLFPETVSVARRPTNNFGGIFCDREAARFQRAVAERAPRRWASTCRPTPPPSSARPTWCARPTSSGT